MDVFSWICAVVYQLRFLYIGFVEERTRPHTYITVVNVSSLKKSENVNRVIRVPSPFTSIPVGVGSTTSSLTNVVDVCPFSRSTSTICVPCVKIREFESDEKGGESVTVSWMSLLACCVF